VPGEIGAGEGFYTKLTRQYLDPEGSELIIPAKADQPK